MEEKYRTTITTDDPDLEIYVSQLQEIADKYPEVDVGQEFEEIRSRSYMKTRVRYWETGLRSGVAVHYTIMILRYKLAEKWGYRL